MQTEKFMRVQSKFKLISDSTIAAADFTTTANDAMCAETASSRGSSSAYPPPLRTTFLEFFSRRKNLFSPVQPTYAWAVQLVVDVNHQVKQTYLSKNHNALHVGLEADPRIIPKDLPSNSALQMQLQRANYTPVH